MLMASYSATHEIPDNIGDSVSEEKERLRRRMLRYGTFTMFAGVAALSHTSEVKGFAKVSPQEVRWMIDSSGHPFFGLSGGWLAALMKKGAGWKARVLGATLGDLFIEGAQNLKDLHDYGVFPNLLAESNRADTFRDYVASLGGGVLGLVLQKKPKA